MAKRFTDTDKWKRPWFAALEPLAKLAWFYLCDECDNCGVWHKNLKRMSSDLETSISTTMIESWFGSKLIAVDEDKYFIPSFVRFQYGALNENNKAHRPVISFLKSHNIDLKDLVRTIEGPHRGAQDKDKDSISSTICNSYNSSHHGELLDQVELVGEPPQNLPAKSPDASEVSECVKAWGETLKKFKIHKDPKLDEMHIGRLIKLRGFQKTRLALIGAAHEVGSQGFDPAKYCRITRLLNKPDIFEKLENLGAQNDRGSINSNLDELGYTPEERKRNEAKRRAFEEETNRILRELGP